MPTTRSMHRVDVCENRARTPYRSSSSAATTSFCTSPCRLSAASPSASSRRSSTSGSSSASSLRAAKSAVRWAGSSRLDQRLERGGREPVSPTSGRAPEDVADTSLGSAEGDDLTGRGRPALDEAGGLADVDLGHGDGATRAGDAQPVAHPDLTRPQPQPRPAAARVPVDREDGAGHGVVAAAAELRQKIAQHVAQQRDAHARECRPAEQRREEALPRAAAQRRPDAAHRERAVVDPSREHALVDLGDCLDDGLVVRRDRFDVGVPSALAHRAGELDDVRRQPAADLRDDGCDVGAGAVDLVDEQRGRDADAPQGAPEHDGLRLHALDRRQHQHRGVENGQRALHLGDEVGVTGRVHEVHGQVVDVEGRDRGADGDAARGARGPSSRCASCRRRRCRVRR